MMMKKFALYVTLMVGFSAHANMDLDKEIKTLTNSAGYVAINSNALYDKILTKNCKDYPKICWQLEVFDMLAVEGACHTHKVKKNKWNEDEEKKDQDKMVEFSNKWIFEKDPLLEEVFKMDFDVGIVGDLSLKHYQSFEGKSDTKVAQICEQNSQKIKKSYK